MSASDVLISTILFYFDETKLSQGKIWREQLLYQEEEVDGHYIRKYYDKKIASQAWNL